MPHYDPEPDYDPLKQPLELPIDVQQEKYCPICGVDVAAEKRSPGQPHRCNPRVLAGKQGAHTRATNDSDQFSPEELIRKQYGDRLQRGFAMMHPSFGEWFRQQS